MDEDRFNLECVNGHIFEASRERAIELAGDDQIRRIQMGVLLSAPIIDCSECPTCQTELEIRDRQAREYDLHLWENSMPQGIF